MADLHKLPPGAIYTIKNGQATASAEAIGDTLYINAVCDSLQHLVFTYEKELVRIRNDTENFKRETKKASFFTAIKWGLIGVVVGFIIGIVIRKKRNKI